MNARSSDARKQSLLFVGLVILALGDISRSANAPTAEPSTVSTVEYTWHDSTRDRDVPVKIYYPSAASGAIPVIIFSHGLGGSREGYQYLGEYWAAHGYISVHLQHIGSDDAVWKQQIGQGAFAALSQAANAKNAVDRYKDVNFSIDQLEKVNVDDSSPLKGRLDLKKIGMAGHSFGGQTTMVIAGQVGVLFSKQISFADPRIKAAIAMSPPPSPAKDNYDAAYAPIKVPVFILTGTEDNSPIGKTSAADRRIGFDHISNAPAYLLTFNGGDHMLFSGQRRGPAHATDSLYHQLILEGTTAFWNAYLLGDASALSWFKNGGYAKRIGDNGVFEVKAEASRD